MSLEAILATSLALVTLLIWWYKRPSGLPPGPPRTFLGDNRGEVSPEHPWKTFTEWNKKYGPVISLYLGRTPVIVLGSAQAAWDLLDKRSDIYSGRPRSIMAGEILSWGVRAITMPYGPRYKRWRALMQASLNSTAVAQYRPLQSLESKLLLRKLLDLKDPMEYRGHLSVFQMSVIFRLAYGRRVRTLQDDIVLRSMKAGVNFGKLQVPGKYLVESWPILLWLPHRLQWFRHEVERTREKDLEFYMGLMNDVRKRMANGTAQPSMATLGLERQQEFGMSDLEMAYTLAGPWDAGVGTTVITIEIFLLAMIHYPEVMKKAQAEIDRVVGTSRMPEFEDMESLPYVNAVIKEVARWRPVARTGFPHELIQDDTYDGYFLPKGATVYANINAIMQDPELFSEPEAFRPERFLETTHPKLENMTIQFGFGRRICPGLYIANQSVFIVISRLLWAFDIVAATGADGQPVIPPDDAFVSGLITRPVPFPCAFKTRSKTVEELIVLEADRAEAEAERWDTD
ncbi:cytochrome P450 [Lentinus tigrinus ALCF2SS1-7]|uniref:Cytochrome P450 n=1 Tax=Lentinus tigrinus ALCF2SS1-6 TaxID=1328759 RepID=A0A5C2RPY0_9APHY|nr:cytochrome P450 [Lentinus tigrinus ALCF2SS1-6]RPD73211.1 cytochrome P450 [Lentinus tigrinus ALCF2SS1-7]